MASILMDVFAQLVISSDGPQDLFLCFACCCCRKPNMHVSRLVCLYSTVHASSFHAACPSIKFNRLHLTRVIALETSYYFASKCKYSSCTQALAKNASRIL